MFLSIILAVDGAWSEWSEWNACSKTCVGGYKTRSRKCDNPAPQNDGEECRGVAEERESCQEGNGVKCPSRC